jgi:diguanylate cyclase (GGDEF)-like protein
MKIGNTSPIKARVSVTPSRKVDSPGKVEATAARPAGDVTSILGIPEPELTAKVKAAILTLMQEVDRLRKELDTMRQRNKHLERLADQDSLVPLVNRRAFVRELSRIMALGQRYGVASTLVYFDINGMKQINDTHGHAAGDAALLQVADTVLENVRTSDVVGRLGGDEFGVILYQSDEELSQQKAEMLANAIRSRPLIWEGQDIPISLSYGFYTLTGDENAGDALDKADRAMYAQKQARRKNQ